MGEHLGIMFSGGIAAQNLLENPLSQRGIVHNVEISLRYSALNLPAFTHGRYQFHFVQIKLGKTELRKTIYSLFLAEIKPQI